MPSVADKLPLVGVAFRVSRVPAWPSRKLWNVSVPLGSAQPERALVTLAGPTPGAVKPLSSTVMVSVLSPPSDQAPALIVRLLMVRIAGLVPPPLLDDAKLDTTENEP